MFSPFPADVESWIAFYIQRRHAAAILYTTHDKQLILIYAFPSLSHIKLQLHYGQWQVKHSKPDWIWQQPETRTVKCSPLQQQIFSPMQNWHLPGKTIVVMKANADYKVAGGRLLSSHVFVCLQWCCRCFVFAAKSRLIKSGPVATVVLFHEGKSWCAARARNTTLKIGIRRVNRLGDSE